MFILIRYGEPRCPLPRQVIGRGLLQEPSLEIHPPCVRAYAVVPDLVSNVRPSVEPEDVTVSAADTVSHLRKAVIQALFPSAATDGRPYRVWQFEDSPTSSSYVTVNDLQAFNAKVLEDSTKTIDEALIQSGDVFAVESATPEGKWLSQNESTSSDASSSKPDGLPPTPQSTEGEMEVPRPLFGSGPDFFSKLQTSTSPPSASTSTALTVRRQSPKAGPSKDPRLAAKPSITPGTLGLGNM